MNKSKPVLKWLLRLSEKELLTYQRTVEKWKDEEHVINGVPHEEVELVTNGLTQISSQIATADEHKLVLPNLPIIGRVLMKIASLPQILHSHPTLHHNLLRCLLQLNRPRPGANNNRMKAKYWALKLIRSLTRTRHPIAVCRQAGFTTADVDKKLKLQAIRKYAKTASLRKRHSSDVSNAQLTHVNDDVTTDEMRCLTLLDDVINRNDVISVSCDCLDDAITCLCTMPPSEGRNRLFRNICDRLNTSETNRNQGSILVKSEETLEKVWSSYPPSLERELLREMDVWTDPNVHPEEIKRKISSSKLIHACARNHTVHFLCMKMLERLFPMVEESRCGRYSWIPSMINRTLVLANPELLPVHLPGVLHTLVPLLHLSPIDLPPSFSNHVIESMSHVVRSSDLVRMRSKRLHMWYKDWYTQCILCCLEHPTQKYVTMAAWFRGLSIPLIDLNMSDLLDFLQILLQKNNRQLHLFIHEFSTSSNLHPFRCLLVDLVLFHLVTRNEEISLEVLQWATQSNAVDTHLQARVKVLENLCLVETFTLQDKDNNCSENMLNHGFNHKRNNANTLINNKGITSCAGPFNCTSPGMEVASSTRDSCVKARLALLNRWRIGDE